MKSSLAGASKELSLHFQSIAVVAATSMTTSTTTDDDARGSSADPMNTSSTSAHPPPCDTSVKTTLSCGIDENNMSILQPSCREVLHTMAFGSDEMYGCFNLERGTTFLNHGSYGAAPYPVLSAQAYFVNRMESNPDRFIRYDTPRLLTRARETLAAFVHAQTQDLVLVTNTTTGMNAVLRSLDLQDGDEVLCLNLAYPAIVNALRQICEVTQEVVNLKMVTIEFPIVDDDTAALVKYITSHITEHTRVVVLDHITSATGLVLPLAELIRVCHESYDVPVLVDGAHCPGQLKLDLSTLGADFYVGNLYKWCFAAKGCAFLHVQRRYQSQVRPVVTSLGYGQGYVADFTCQGTRDPSNFCSLVTALDFYTSLGVERAVQYNSRLIDWASDHLAHVWRTDVLLPRHFRAPCMACVRLPLDWPIPATELTESNMVSICDRVAELVLEKCAIVIKVTPVQHQMYVRISAQVYNKRQDYVRLGQMILRLTKEPRQNSMIIAQHLDQMKL